MAIQIGDRIPEVNIKRINDGIDTVDTHRFFEGRRVVLFSVPGAFTPTCSEKHLPGFIAHFDDFRAKGVGVACMSVNDPFVMKAWAESTGGMGKITYLSDGSAKFAQQIGLALDLTERGLGMRNQRFSMLLDDGVVKALNIEETPGTADATGAEAMLKAI